MDQIIQIFVTGGTFDKEYNYITGELYFKDTHLPEMFERGRSILETDVKTLMMVDSLQMTDADREIISYHCKQSPHNKIIITHGTDTMVETASKIARKKFKKTIILTGAMIPYAFGTSSDGFFNLGSALSFVQILPHGVYVVMNGKVFPWNNVQKNKKTGYFETLNG
ncbi:MAG: asparaginase [Saprospiraceae bacterium]|nr:asparaginase [Saprospiraceae bacterium]MBK6565704.1 asparaginase [Saprospiraceae bacterium]MBK6784652.1 asparaginase [Saprospiraceae bacterium]MBK7525264.1 asparaginase [Saprospiraceae bacterium]MBK8082124.1 asparaginase [Saprospiraceae bacterium]